MSGNRYRAIATYNRQSEISNEVTLTVNGAPSGGGPPAAPTGLAAKAFSSNQIDLSWKDNATNETGYIVERSTASGSYSTVKTLSANSIYWSDTIGLSPNTTYFYRVSARNSPGDSGPSNVATATTLAGSGFTYTLTINSSNPSSGVSVSSFVGSSSYVTSSTPATPSFSAGTSVGVTCPQTLTTGQTFQKWLLDGSDYDFDTYAIVPMNGPHTLTAVYGTSAPVSKTLSSLSISGPSSVDEGASAQYRATASYSDGSTADVTSSAKWIEDSSYADISKSGVLDADTVSSDKSVEIEAEYTSGGVTRTASKSITISNTATSATSYTLTLNAVNGSISASPKMSSYPAGTEVRLKASPDDGYLFAGWSGAGLSGTDRTVYLTMDGDKAVTANFATDTSEGAVTVNIEPFQATSEGASWKVLGKVSSTNWQPAGDTFTHLKPGSYTITFQDVPGWTKPDNIKVSISGGPATVVTGVYREILGTVQCAIEPPEAASGGASWKIDNGEWQPAGAALGDVTPGTHTISFSASSGWQAPASRPVTVDRGQVAVVTAIYDPATGQPLITGVTPNTGILEGEIPVTITGANFQAGATVSFGGRPATNVTVKGAGEITAIVPAGAKYGTVPVSVTSGGQTATKLAGFTYDIPLGINMALVSQLGGDVRAVAVKGTMVYYGEGNSLVAADFSNPAAPILRGRIALPGLVGDIRISDQHALIANEAWGLQIVDITDPANLKRIGFYDTPGRAVKLAIADHMAYVADDFSGLHVIDFSDPAAPVKKATTQAAEGCGDVKLAVIGGRKIACVASVTTTEGAALLDVTDFDNITKLATLEPGLLQQVVDLNNTTLILSDNTGGVGGKNLYDISDPSQPRKLGHAQRSNRAPALIARDHLFVGEDNFLEVQRMSDVLDPPNEIISYDFPISGESHAMTLLNATTLLLANGQGGLIVIDITAPTASVVRSTLNSGFNAQDVLIKDQTAFVSLGGGFVSGGAPSLTALDVANPRKPRRLGTALSTTTGSQLILAGGNLYGINRRAIQTFDIGTPSTPSESGTRATDRNSFDAAQLGRNLLVAGQTRSGSPLLPLLTVFDGENPASASPLFSMQLSDAAGRTDAIAVSGTIVFAILSTDANPVLRIYDYATPASPQLLGSVTLPITVVRRIAVSDDGHYVFATGSGLMIFDCTDRANPKLLTTYKRNNVSATTPVVTRGRLVFCGDTRGLNVLDFTDPANPALVAAYDSPGTPAGIFLDGNTVYLADQESGLQILELGDTSKPLIEITSPTRNSVLASSADTISLAGTASDAQGIAKVSWSNNRGGGGQADGTSAWHADGIPLYAGENILTVSAEDTNGNIAEDSLTVTATFADATAPIVSITGPRQDGEFTVNADRLTLSGSAADDRDVATVVWANERGGNGIAAILGHGWSTDSIPLEEGPNKITVTATDAAGNETSASVVVFYAPPDGEPPVVTIDFPTVNATYQTSSGTINLSGESSDDQSVKTITWSNSRGGSGAVSGTAPWWVNGIPLQAGLNVIDITATDASGNVSTDTLSITSSPAEPPATPTPTPPPVSRPKKPTGLQAQEIFAAGSDMRIKLRFLDRTRTADRFEVRGRSLAASGKWSKWKNLKRLKAHGDATAYLSLLRMKKATAYQFRIIAINKAGKAESRIITVRAPKTEKKRPEARLKPPRRQPVVSNAKPFLVMQTTSR